MKTIEIKLYKFNELSAEAKEKVIEDQATINVDYEWWEFVYEDAEQIGLKITSFDIDRASYVNAEFIESAEETAQKIIDSHGESCETYKTAKEFLSERDALVEKHSDEITIDIVDEDNEAKFDEECDYLEEEFLKSLSEDYRIMLSKEYDHLTSDEAIEETIKANDYDFTADGELYP